MKLYKRDFIIDKAVICVLPTIIIRPNDRLYNEKNLSLEFHWLALHTRLLWLDRKE